MYTACGKHKLVERMAVRGGWRPLSALMCEIVNSVGQGNFPFVREKSGILKTLMAVATLIWKHTSTVGSVQLVGTFWSWYKKYTRWVPTNQ